jgi:hypothetical protein
MTNSVDFLAFKRAAGLVPTPSEEPQPAPVAKPETQSSEWSTVRDDAFPPAVSHRDILLAKGHDKSVLRLLRFKLSASFVVDEDGRDYLESPASHERCRAFFAMFGFDLDQYARAEDIFELWLTLKDFYVPFVRHAIAEPRHFDVMASGFCDDWHNYIHAVVAGDTATAGRLSSRVRIGTLGF